MTVEIEVGDQNKPGDDRQVSDLPRIETVQPLSPKEPNCIVLAGMVGLN